MILKRKMMRSINKLKQKLLQIISNKIPMLWNNVEPINDDDNVLNPWISNNLFRN